MPKQKDLKRLVRTRMQKTGESYTAARARVVAKTTLPTAGKTPVSRYAEVAGMSDDAVVKRTGKNWQAWVRALDAADAMRMPHRDIARYVRDHFTVTGWWAQMVTVSYERIRGLRDIGQRRGGRYEASKSKTFAVPVTRLYDAFSDARQRRRWLPGVDLRIRTARRGKSMRVTWPDGTPVDVYFVSKGADKSTVTVQHRELERKADVETMKARWAERFAALAAALGTPTRRR